MSLIVKRIDKQLPLGIERPKYLGDAGSDLISLYDVVVVPHGFKILKHNFAVDIPVGYYGYIYPRSSIITKYRGMLLIECSPIDCGFRGEIFTMVTNLSDEEIFIPANSRISQFVLIKHATVLDIDEQEVLSPSSRGTNGFGSSGT